MVYYRAEDGGGLEERRCSGNLTYLLPWLAWLIGSQGMPSGVGGGDKGRLWEKICVKIWGWDREEGETTADVCYGAGDVAWGLGRVPEAQPRLLPLLNKVEGRVCAVDICHLCGERRYEQHLLHSPGSLCLAT